MTEGRSVTRTRKANRVLKSLSIAIASVVLAGCLAQPPGHLPSSIRILYSKATSDSLGSRTDIYFVVAREGNELQLTGEEGVDREPEFARGLGRVFFAREVSGDWQIWSMDLDGGDEVAVLAESGVDFRDPSISPDERSLAYTRTRGGSSRIEIVDVDGEASRTVVEGGGPWRQPAWSPDGRTLAVVGGEGEAARIHLVPATGGEPRPLVGPGAGRHADPDWSPTGDRIAFVLGSGSAAEIAIAAVGEGEARRITDNDVEDASPTFNPSGDRVGFSSQRPHGRWNLWIVGVDGEGQEALTRNERSDARDPDWI